ncbi:OmpH family outer membrane protein [Rhodoferax sp. BAB1]|uniref:OmpH family outer membrane protein n=1 Tax=Rhodoferax sp. BAB1 TaxID=2741720 RepID=UPI001575E699|nr:OmpH family outer membrane protein [Rhodoferax sp. BAB1]QKO21420.1 OmpH family outer membrane protein [Rhodoferax sp. BAB1]
MKYFIRPATLLLGLSLLAVPALAQEFRLGFVSLDRIIKEAVPAKNAQAKLEQEFAKREKDLQAQGASIKSSAEQLEREAPTLSESQRVSRQKQLVELDRDFQRKRREFQEDLNARRNEELQQVFERANRVVKQVADAEKYDLILQEAVYVNPRHDITDKVIKALNATVVK